MNTTFARCATAVALCAAAGGAQAANVTLNNWAQGAGTVVATTGYAGWAGGFGGSLEGAGAFDSTSFITYSIELEEQFTFSSRAMTDYTVAEGGEYFARRRGDAGIADRLGRLFTFAADHPEMVDSSFESSALQEAVWNLVYDNDFTVTMSRSGFRDNTPGSRLGYLADLLLAGAQGVTTSRFDVYTLEKSGSQDFVMLTARSPQRDVDVPEPGTLALGAAALGGLALTRRRKA